MVWSFIRNWFFSAIAFGVVGGQVLWAAASFVRALAQIIKSGMVTPSDKAAEAFNRQTKQWQNTPP